MDEIVRQAMAKWPNVPHCFGWLALDARGAFRMRDEAAQTSHAAGDVIRHPALLSFIYRNYHHDANGAWYFQNGPQRVYVELEATPYIARTSPTGGFITHDGQPMPDIDSGWITDEGRLILRGGDKLAMVDDRDLAECAAMLYIDGAPADEEAMCDWLERQRGALQLDLGARRLAVQPLSGKDIGRQLGFAPHPSLWRGAVLNAVPTSPAS